MKWGSRGARVGIAWLAALLLMASAASAATIKVTTVQDPDNGTGDCATTDHACSLREAINVAAGGATISLPAGIYRLTDSAGALPMVNSVTLVGAGARTTTIKQTLSGDNVITTGADRTITIKGVTITGGRVVAAGRIGGGGISNAARLTLKNSTVSGNEADGYYDSCSPPLCTPMSYPGVGGGISNDGGSLTLIRSTISGNKATQGSGFGSAEGGGIFSNYPVTVVNSTIAGNSADGSGGGIDVVGSSAQLTLFNATIAFNTAFSGGNLYLDPTAPSAVKNTVIARGSAGSGPNCAGDTLTSQGHNLEDGKDCGLNGPGDRTSVNANVGKLGNHGGPTDTVPLVAGSPAINGGVPVGCFDPSQVELLSDQRGVLRPQGNRCDTGAFEFRVPSLRGTPRISGEHRVGQRLTCVFTVLSPDGPATATVAWLRGTRRVASGKTYTVRSADAGHSLRCRVTARNSAGSVSATGGAVSISR